MKGASYLVDEQGTRTHDVLELGEWQAMLMEDVSAQPPAQQARRPGFLTELLTRAGCIQKQLDEMNRRSAKEALGPLTAEELGLSSSPLPTCSTLIHSCGQK